MNPFAKWDKIIFKKRSAFVLFPFSFSESLAAGGLFRLFAWAIDCEFYDGFEYI